MSGALVVPVITDFSVLLFFCRTLLLLQLEYYQLLSYFDVLYHLCLFVHC